ncbi:MAG: methyltransferase [Verrucomicrobiales bacterium]
MEEGNQPTPDHILQTGLAFWASKTLLSAVELELFTQLSKAPTNLNGLTDLLGLHPRGARDFLDALVSIGFLERDDSGIYHNAPDADVFLDKAKPSYVGGILEMANHRLYPFWGKLTDALKTGLPQNESIHDPEFFNELYADPDRLYEFLSAMTGVSHAANVAIATSAEIGWSERRTFADIGPAQGDLALQIAIANPHLEGTGFDLPPVGPIFKTYMQDHGVADRVHFQPGSFFDEPLPQADVITMGHILHDWDLEQKKMLVAKAHAALPSGGILVVYDSLIDDDRRSNSFGLLMSLNMLVETPGGFDYTGADGVGWIKEAGFKEANVVHLVGPDSMIVAVK